LSNGYSLASFGFSGRSLALNQILVMLQILQSNINANILSLSEIAATTTYRANETVACTFLVQATIALHSDCVIGV